MSARDLQGALTSRQISATAALVSPPSLRSSIAYSSAHELTAASTAASWAGSPRTATAAYLPSMWSVNGYGYGQVHMFVLRFMCLCSGSYSGSSSGSYSCSILSSRSAPQSQSKSDPQVTQAAQKHKFATRNAITRLVRKQSDATTQIERIQSDATTHIG